MRPKNDADWYRKFDESVPPSKRRQLATFKDAGTYVTLQMTLYLRCKVAIDGNDGQADIFELGAGILHASAMRAPSIPAQLLYGS